MNNNEPVILGKVKKGKTGKPLVVLILFLFIGSIVLFLPSIMGYFGDYNVIDLIKNGEIITFIQNHDSYVNGSKTTTTTVKNDGNTNNQVLINSKAVIKYNNFNLNNFNLKKDSISFDIVTSNNIDFDSSKYYLVLLKDDKEVNYIKLVGSINGTSSYNFKFNNKLDDILDYYGIVKEINVSEYPNFTLSSDESGLSNMICSLDNRSIEYMFQYNKLITIKDSVNVSRGNDYSKNYSKYSNLSKTMNSIGANAIVTENNNGFLYFVEINLNSYDYKNNKDSNYYSLNTLSKVVKFEMNSKGYDCE